MADDAVDLRIDQLLRHGRALLRIGGVVFGDELEARLAAADRHALGIQLVDGHAGTEFIVLAEVRVGAAERCDVPDLDHQFLRHRGASEKQEGRCGNDVELDLHGENSGSEWLVEWIVDRTALEAPCPGCDLGAAGRGFLG